MFGHDRNSQKIYETEINTLKRVADHDHLIKVSGTYTDKKYLAMLLIPVADENLKQYMNRKLCLSEEEKTNFRTYFGCLANTISFLHSAEIGILHKDIKPENILLRNGELILTDFGTAFDWSKTGQSMTRSNSGDVRTPRYQSPEVHRAGDFHRSADIWSLGIVFLEMVTILRGKTVDAMDSFLQENGRQSAAIYLNLEGAMKWFETLTSSLGGSPSDNEPLTWIKAMLVMEQHNRLKAPELFGRIAAYNDGVFCGQCCRDIESDEDPESDGGLLSTIVEEPDYLCQSSYENFGIRAGTDAVPSAVSERISIKPDKLPDDKALSSTDSFTAQPQSNFQAEALGPRIDGDRKVPGAFPEEAVETIKVAGKSKAKTIVERESFIQWLAMVPKSFNQRKVQVRSRRRDHTEQRSSISERKGTVEGQRIDHFLSSLPDDATDYLGSDIQAFEFEEPVSSWPLGGQNSSVSPSTYVGLKRSNSEDKLPLISQPSSEEAHEAEVGDTRIQSLIHYASDSNLREIAGMSNRPLREIVEDLKSFVVPSNVLGHPGDADQGHGTSDDRGERKYPEMQTRQVRSDHSMIAQYSSHPRAALSPGFSFPQDISLPPNEEILTTNLSAEKSNPDHNTVPRVASGQPNTSSQRSCLTASDVKPSTNDGKARPRPKKENVVPRLDAFVTGPPKKRKRGWESATAIMERVLNDKATVAPTSVMSDRARNIVSSNKPFMRWNDRSYGYLPFYVKEGKIAAVRELLRAGCNPGTRRDPRWGPVRNAIMGKSDRHNKCLQALVAHGADINVRRSINGRSPLHYAIGCEQWPGYSTAIYILLVAGADPNAKDYAGDIPLLMLLSGNGPLPREKRDALFLLLAPNFTTSLNVSFPGTLDNPLHLAIRLKDPHTVDAVMQKAKQNEEAADIRSGRNASGFTPLLLAFFVFALGKDSDDEIQIIKLLLENGCNPSDTEATQGDSPMHLVIATSKNSIVVEMLCRHSADGSLRYIKNNSGVRVIDLLRKRQAEHPQDKWFGWAKQRIGTSKLEDSQYRPPDLVAYLADETERVAGL